MFGPVSTTLSPSADLRVESVIAPASADEGAAIDVTWTVYNRGDAAAAGSWTDRVVIEQVGVADPERFELGRFQYTGSILAGLPYTRTEHLKLPDHIQGAYRVVVTTNFLDELYERPDTSTNNTDYDPR